MAQTYKPITAWTPILLFALGTWVSAAVVITFEENAYVGQCLSAFWGAMVCGLVVLVVLMKGHAHHVLIPVLGCCLGISIAGAGGASLHALTERIQNEDCIVEELRALDDSKEGEFGSSCIAQAILPDGTSVKVRVNAPDEMSIRCWQYMHVRCNIKPPSKASESYYWKKGCVGSVSPRYVRLENPEGVLGVIFSFRECCLEACDRASDALGEAYSDGFSMLAAMLYGYRANLLESDLYDQVKIAGLAHIVAVSGAHLVMMTGFFAVALRALRVPRKACAIIQCMFVLTYAAFAGMPISALRAAIMSMCSASAVFAGRRSSSVSALSLCVIAMLASHPFLCVSTSLALSSSASLGIILLSRKISGLIDVLLAGHARFLSQTIGATLAANVLTIGISSSMFSQMPLISPISNVLAVPVFTLMICMGMVATIIAVVFPSITAAVFFPVAMLSQAFAEAVGVLSRLPYACIPVDAKIVPTLAIGLVAVLVLYRTDLEIHAKKIAAACACALAAIAILGQLTPSMHGVEVVMIDVGQGDAVLYRSGKHAMLIDTGTEDDKVLAGLARHGIRHLDAIVISHPDDDHCGSLRAITQVVPTEHVLVARDLLSCDCQNCRKLLDQARGCDMIPLASGNLVSFGAFHVEVIGPDQFQDKGGNVDSLVMRIGADCDGDELADWTVLTSGDAEADVVMPLIRQSRVEHVDILKVAHHGSSGSVNELMLKQIDPQVCLISVGEGNRYGHPTQDTLDALLEHGDSVFRTDRDGDVVCSLTHAALRVRTLR